MLQPRLSTEVAIRDAVVRGGSETLKVVAPVKQNTLLLPLAFLEAVDSWFKVLLPKIYPFLYHNGGNIISIQV